MHPCRSKTQELQLVTVIALAERWQQPLQVQARLRVVESPRPDVAAALCDLEAADA